MREDLCNKIFRDITKTFDEHKLNLNEVGFITQQIENARVVGIAEVHLAEKYSLGKKNE